MREMSLKNIEQFSKQEVFDFVAEKLLAQGRRALSQFQYSDGFVGSPRCSYHNDTGDKCAVGHILSEEEHKLVDEFGINGMSVTTVSLRLGYDVPDGTLLFLLNLQDCHDSSVENEGSFVSQFVHSMTNLAERERLNTTKLDELASQPA